MLGREEKIMGPSYEQTPQTSSKDTSHTTYEFAMKLSKFIMWFSVFTFFLSNPSWLSLFLHSFISHVSSFPSQLLSRINDKHYIFLLCNGILVILAKSSRRLMNGNSESLQPPEVVTTTNEALQVTEAAEEREILVLQNHGLIEMEPEVKENEFLVEEGEYSSDTDEDCDDCYVKVRRDLAEAASIARMSTEDLNRKFEEFIRRMKEEIRIEAQQQLIMV